MNKAITEVLAHPLPNVNNRPLAFSVLRVPFLLEPSYDETKPFVESNRDRLIQKWGGPAGWERQKKMHNLKGRGMEAGIPHFNLDRLASNTMASHRLIQYLGKTYGLHVSEAIYDRLNVYYFVEGHALNDKPRLAHVVAEELQALIPEQHAPTEQVLLEFLNGNQGRREIEKALTALRQIGIHSIPKFVVEGRTVVDGAANAATFVSIFREIEKRGVVHPGTMFGDILGVSTEILERGSHRSDEATKTAAY